MLIIQFNLLGRENTMVVTIGGVERVDTSSLVIDVVDTHGRALEPELKLQHIDDMNVFQTKSIPPRYPFKVKLRGMFGKTI